MEDLDQEFNELLVKMRTLLQTTLAETSLGFSDAMLAVEIIKMEGMQSIAMGGHNAN